MELHRTCIDENEAFLDSAFSQAGLDLGSDIHKSAPGGTVKPEFFSVGFHI
jgi:hypothetical protein